MLSNKPQFYKQKRNFKALICIFYPLCSRLMIELSIESIFKCIRMYWHNKTLCCNFDIRNTVIQTFYIEEIDAFWYFFFFLNVPGSDLPCSPEESANDCSIWPQQLKNGILRNFLQINYLVGPLYILVLI